MTQVAHITLAARDGQAVEPPAGAERDGFVPVPNSILDGLLLADLNARQLKLVMAIVRLTFGYGKPEGADLTITGIAQKAGVSRPAASVAFHALLDARVIDASKGTKGLLVKVNRPACWQLARLEKTVTNKPVINSEVIDKTAPYQNDTNVSKQDVRTYQNDTVLNIQVLYTKPPYIPPIAELPAELPADVVSTTSPDVCSAADNGAAPKQRRRDKLKTFATFLTDCKPLAVKPFDGEDPLFVECETLGVDHEWVQLAWRWFKLSYGEGGERCRKKYVDWRAVFRRSVREVWCGFWFLPADGSPRQLTSKGREFAQRVEKGML